MSNSDDMSAILPVGFQLSNRLGRKLRTEWEKPEGKVRALWVVKLVDQNL